MWISERIFSFFVKILCLGTYREIMDNFSLGFPVINLFRFLLCNLSFLYHNDSMPKSNFWINFDITPKMQELVIHFVTGSIKYVRDNLPYWIHSEVLWIFQWSISFWKRRLMKWLSSVIHQSWYALYTL